MDAIKSFVGKYAFLSNFYPVFVKLDGDRYPAVEDAYQAAKTTDHLERAPLLCMSSPAEAKRYGRKVTLRADWESVKVDVMRNLLVQKFNRPDLKEKLLATADAELVEGNNHGDTFWGVCRGEGRNILGKLLMEIRNTLKEGR